VKSSASAIGLAPLNSDTYKWRGDLGLLDRLSYRNSKEIPRGWEMTSLDADQIAQYQFAPSEPPLQTTRLLGDSNHLEIIDENNDPPQTSFSINLNTDRNDNLREPQKKKRYLSRVVLLTYRIRIDKKKREKGNNPYGRTGLLKCLQCRRRSWKVSPLCSEG
jgi:hypothetical protein